jgi:hypothetical protein
LNSLGPRVRRGGNAIVIAERAESLPTDGAKNRREELDIVVPVSRCLL